MCVRERSQREREMAREREEERERERDSERERDREEDREREGGIILWRIWPLRPHSSMSQGLTEVWLQAS